MIGLNGSLSIAENSLAAQYAGIANANNNIANANTAGYSRQTVTLTSQAYTLDGKVVDAGVAYTGTTSIRDEVLNLAIVAKNSEQSSLSTQNTLLTQINTDFSSTTSGVGNDLSNLFTSLSALSTKSSNSSARQEVLTAAAQLVNSFHDGAASLRSASATADQKITGTVAQINQVTSEIAHLNEALAQTSQLATDGGALEDQRDALTTQLAQLTGLNITRTESTPSIATSGGSALVVGTAAYALEVTTASDGHAHILDSNGQDITSSLVDGELGGLIAVRDTTLPALSSELDTLASQFGSAVNAIQVSGYNAAGNPGTPIFSLPLTSSGTAQDIAVALTDPAGLALSSSSNPQDTANLDKLLSIESSVLPSGAAPGDAYGNFVRHVGAAGAQTSMQLKACTTSLGQLTAQRDTESGVSVDEETVSLVRFQQAYTAAAKVIATLNSLYSTLLNMTNQGG